MSVSIKIRDGRLETLFTYYGKHSRLWVKSVDRLLSNFRGDKAIIEVCNGEFEETYACSGTALRLLRCRVKNAYFFTEVEKAVDDVKKENWKRFWYDFNHDNFRDGIRRVWSLARQEGLLSFEQEVYDVVALNGGLSLEQIISEFLEQGKLHTFKEVKNALTHLQILYVVEKYQRYYSIRHGILKNA